MAAFYFMYWTNGYAGQWLDLPGDGPLYQAATAMALAAVVFTQIGNVFAQRSERRSIFRINPFVNRLIWVGVAVELLLVIAITYTPFLQAVIGTAPFPAWHWLFLVAWVPALIVMDELRKALLRWREPHVR
jgi:Ca2+-transporting ATPase